MPANILIADDYDDNRELLRLMLVSEGHNIREARDGRECVAEAATFRPDLILIDLSMPNLDGWGTLRSLRADERTRRTPCVAVTAFASDDDRRRALAAGFDDYLAKPFRSRDLLDLVTRLLDRRASIHTSNGSTPEPSTRKPDDASALTLDRAQKDTTATS